MVLKEIYQKIMSENIRKEISAMRSIPRKYIIKHRVIRYLSKNYSNKKEISDILKFLKNNSLQVFPYEFTRQYSERVKVYADSQGYRYVIFNGKRLYGKEAWDDEQFITYYNMLLKEQDPLSPHCYFSTNKNRPKKSDIVADIGGAEGIFSLSVIDDVKKIYIFEGDPEWIQPLRRTFSPWSHKVEIVEKYIGKEVRDNIITLDDFFKNKDVTFLKADIEGWEGDMLLGGRKIFCDKLDKVLMVAYHKPDDEKMILKYMNHWGYNCRFNSGFMLLFFSPNFKPPYIRKGVVCCERKE